MSVFCHDIHFLESSRDPDEQYGNGMEVRTRTEKTYYDEGTVMTEEVYRSYEDQPEYLESA